MVRWSFSGDVPTDHGGKWTKMSWCAIQYTMLSPCYSTNSDSLHLEIEVQNHIYQLAEIVLQ
jgi:hypothetical protein